MAAQSGSSTLVSFLSKVSGAILLGCIHLASASPLVPGQKNVLPQALSPHPLIVVHATTEFDDGKMAAAGIDHVVQKFKEKKESVTYLVSDQSKEGYEGWYTKDRSPDFEIFSEGGEHNLPVAADEVTIVGGFFGSYDGARGCQTLATRDTMRMHFEVSDHPLTIHMPLSAIYFWSEDSMMREQLLKLDVAVTRKSAIRKLFERFFELFFLVENFSDSPEFSHPYFGDQNPSYRQGDPVSVDRYHFTLLINGVQATEAVGTGPRQVVLSLENGLY